MLDLSLAGRYASCRGTNGNWRQFPSWGGAVRFKRFLIVADIEGSSGCWSRQASVDGTDEWALACREMSADVNCLATALLDAGADRLVIQDFHRSAHNILPELIDPRAELVSGYHDSGAPGFADMGGIQAVLFIGMHAASGTEGFLAHTLTSRLAMVEVSGKPVSEFELFAAALARWNIHPLFFSGCPIACSQAAYAVPGLGLWPIDKSAGPRAFDSETWRLGLKQAALRALENENTRIFCPLGPTSALVRLRDEGRAIKLSRLWGLPLERGALRVDARDMADLYYRLALLCYFTPFLKAILPLALVLFNAKGRLGRAWVRRRLRSLDACSL